MLLRWLAGIALFGALTLNAHAEEKDPPLPFDEPAAANQLAKKKTARTSPAVAKRTRGTQATDTKTVATPKKSKVSAKKNARKPPKATPKKKRVAKKKSATKKKAVAPKRKAKKTHKKTRQLA